MPRDERRFQFLRAFMFHLSRVTVERCWKFRWLAAWAPGAYKTIPIASSNTASASSVSTATRWIHLSALSVIG